MATINMITDTEQHQVAVAGFEASICSRADSMCAVVLDHHGLVVVPDARLDPRFRDNPFVTGQIGHVRFYATHPLRHPGGDPDRQPVRLRRARRAPWTPEQERALAGLAGRVVDLLELDLRTRELSATVSQLHTAQTALVRSNERLTAFAGQVSHDLRNPLGALLMGLGLIEEQRPPEAAAVLDPLLARTSAAARRMGGLVEDLLSFARLGGEVNPVEVDLGAVVADVLEDLSPVLAGAAVSVSELPRSSRGPGAAACPAAEPGGQRGEVHPRPASRPPIDVTGTRGGPWWRIEVCDAGAGVPVEDRERVFAPLARVDDSREGSGIGLATCRRVVEAHGGRIGLADSPAGGTCAWFELPVGSQA